MENSKKLDGNTWVDERMSKLEPDGEWQPDTARAFSALRAKTAHANTSRHKLVWATLVVTAAAAALLAHPASRVFAERCIAACRDLFSGNGSPAEVLVSEMAPDFALQDAAGNTHRLSDYRGKVVLLNFWASWCPPCKEEIPLLQEFARTYADQGFDVVGVAMDEEGWKSVKPFMEQMNIDYPIVLGEASVAKRYGTYAFPESYLIDREGRVVAKYSGVVKTRPLSDSIGLLLGATALTGGGNPSESWPAAEPQTSPPARIKVAGDVQATKAIHMVPPVYPPDARAKGVEGTVNLGAIIDVSGTVKELTVLSGDSVLASAAMTAVRQWVYRPTLLNGRPVEVETTIRVTFTLHEPAEAK